MLVQLRRALVFSVLLVVLCLAYTGVETVIGQVAFSHQANGSLVREGNNVVGSSLIGEAWNGPKWFQGRDDAFTSKASGPTNYGPRSEQLYKQVIQKVAALKKEGIKATNGLVTGSGSGLDPDISPSSAYSQVDTVARANNLPVAEVRTLVAEHVAPVYLGIFGSPYVNVLSLNLALARLRAEVRARRG